MNFVLKITTTTMITHFSKVFHNAQREAQHDAQRKAQIRVSVLPKSASARSAEAPVCASWRTSILLCMIALFALAPASVLHAQDMPIPVRIHVALLKKMFSFNRNFQNNPTPKVVIVFTDASASVKDAAQKAFTEIGIPVTAMKLDQALKSLGEADAVYVAPGAEAIQKICDERKILTMTGIPAMVETGKVAVGIGAEGGKPKVYVNMALMKTQKQDLTADLLRVAKVIQ